MSVQLQEGQEFPPMTVSVDRARLVAYAAASGDRNRIHWDADFARGVGLPDVIAHGMWTMGAAGAVVEQWVGGPVPIRAYATKFSAPVVVPASGDVTIRVAGRVKKVDGAVAMIDLDVTCGDDKVLTRAQAVVDLTAAGVTPVVDAQGGAA